MTTPTLHDLADECAQMAACILDPQEIHDKWLAYSQLAKSAANFREKVDRMLNAYTSLQTPEEARYLIQHIQQRIRAL